MTPANYRPTLTDVRRHLNFSITKWYQETEIFIEGGKSRAICSERQDLPWTANEDPTVAESNEMRMVCVQCPIIFRCADFALNSNGRGVEGGFYAGVWLPWSDSEGARAMRRKNRDRLRLLLKGRG